MNNGFINMGNTCYLNTSLQCLLNTSIFSDFLDTGKVGKSELFASIKQAITNFATPIDLSSVLELLASHLKNKINLREQNDMQEFIVIFIDELNKEICHEISNKKIEQCNIIRNNRSISAVQRFRGHVEYEWLQSNKREYSELIPVFYGQQITQLECNKCACLSHNYENFMAIPLCFTSNTNQNIDELIHHFMSPEDIPSRDCDGCKKKQGAKKSHKFWRLPQILMLFIKRFDSNLKKINSPINIEETLDLSAYTVKSSRPYKLVSIGCHCGSMNNGHYFAICKHPNNKWAVHDDDSVRFIDDYKSVASNLYYVLFYEI